MIGPRPPSARFREALAFAVLLLIAVSLQVAGGAYSTDLAGASDEPAHYVSGLLVRDFLLTPSAWPFPLRFAQDFYDHYPKVAIGHWPPFFYLAQALWTVLFTADRASILLFMAVLAAATATVLYRFLEREFGSVVALAGALTLLILPLAQQYARMVMAEFLVCLLVLLAALSYARYLESDGRPRHAALFSLLAALAIMTKPNGLALALLPPLAALASQRLALARRLSFWLPALLIGFACGPWYVATLGMALEGWAPVAVPPLPVGDGVTGMAAIAEGVAGSTSLDVGPGAADAVGVLAAAVGRAGAESSVRNLAHLVDLLGPALLPLVAVGLLARIVLPWRDRRVDPGWAVLGGLLMAFWMFHSFVAPVGEPRHTLLSAPAVVAFAVAGADRLRHLLLARGLRRWAVVPLAAALLIVLAHAFPVRPKPWSGAIPVADAIASDPTLAGARILVSSNAQGEGAIIAELAMREDRPARQVLRASKVLSSSTWSGDNYKPKFSTSDEIRRFLSDKDVLIVVIGDAPGYDSVHHELLRDSIADDDSWVPMRIASAQGRPVRYAVHRRPGRDQSAALRRRGSVAELGLRGVADPGGGGRAGGR